MKVEINLWELMGKNKLSAKKLSELSGISAQHISSIKNGKTTKISLETIGKFLEAFKCTPNDLFKVLESKENE